VQQVHHQVHNLKFLQNERACQQQTLVMRHACDATNPGGDGCAGRR
jgi:hypothetical protein